MLDIQTNELTLRVQPIHPATLRVIPLDAYERLARTFGAVEEDLAQGVRRSGFADAGIIIVSFYGSADRARFSADDISIRGSSFLRAAAVIPLTPNWSTGVVESRRTERAILVLNGPLDVLAPFSVTYRGTTNARWDRRRLSMIEDELTRARGRAATEGR